MPSAFQIGPMMLAADRALAVLLIGIFMVIASVIGRRIDQAAERASFWALCMGILAARAGFVASNWDAFAAEPSSILAVWQGGFSLAAGVIAAIATIVIAMRLHRSVLPLAATVALLSGAYLVGADLLRPTPRPLPTGIVLEQWSGDQLHLAQLRGRPFVINLWASWCLPCRREMPMLVDVASRSSIPILLVNSGEEREVAGRFLRANRLPSGPVYFDPAGALAKASGAGGYPATLFVNAAGQVETMHLGEISRPILSKDLLALEKGQR